MSDRLKEFHDELEGRVRSRTAELEAATEELKGEINRRKLAERDRQQSEERYRALFEGINSGGRGV